MPALASRRGQQLIQKLQLRHFLYRHSTGKAWRIKQVKMDGARWMAGWILEPELAKNYRASEIWGMATSAPRSSLRLSRLICGGSTFTPGGIFECQEHYLTPTYYHSNKQQSTKSIQVCLRDLLHGLWCNKKAGANESLMLQSYFLSLWKPKKTICVEAGETRRLHPSWPLNPQSELRSASPGRRDEEARHCHSSCTKKANALRITLGHLQAPVAPNFEASSCWNSAL